MKNVMGFLVLLILASGIVMATPGMKPQGIDGECQMFGFDYGIVKWEWQDGEWIPEGGDGLDTVVIGSDVELLFDGTGADAEGLIVKAGSTVHYAIIGASGTVEQDKPATSHVTFCGNDEPGMPKVPEFPTMGAFGILLGAGIYVYVKRTA